MNRERRIIAETEDLEIGYRQRSEINMVMKGLSLHAIEGELIALIGRNGLGKSTLLRTLVGLQPAIKGNIRLRGKLINEISRSELPRLVSYTSTEPIAVRNIKVTDAVSLGRFPYTNWVGMLTEEDQKIVNEALEATGLTSLSDRSIDNISDGEKQRTLIARSLAQDTGLLVMDEPTAFLDLPSRYSIISLLRQLTREHNKCVIYSTHDLDTAFNEADKIWLMSDGNVAEGAPEDLMLRGSVEKAFKSPMLSFSMQNGTFSIVRDRKMAVELEGKGTLVKLTARALNRCGYATETGAEIKVKVQSANDTYEWIITRGANPAKCLSLYDLLSRLQEEETY